jgi:hypothetical protein
MNRKLLLGGLLAATVALTLWTRFAARETAEPITALSAAVAPVQLAARRSLDETAPEAASEPLLQLPQRADTSPPGANSGALFGRPPRKAVAVPIAAPAPPTAPPLPFTFGGRLVVDGEVGYLLNEAGRTVVLRTGELAGEFVLESADERQLQFRHQPTGLAVVLATEG